MKRKRKQPPFSPQAFQKTWNAMTKKEWQQAYDSAFRTHAQNMGLRPIGWGQKVPLTPGNMELHRLTKNLKSVMEYGSSHGYLVLTLLEEGVDAMGIDPSSAATQFAKANRGGKYQDAFVCMNEDQLAQAGDQYRFDCVVAGEIFNMCQEPKRLLGILWNRVKEGGQLVIAFSRHGDNRARGFSVEDVEDVGGDIAEDYPGRITQMKDDIVLTLTKDRHLFKYCQVVTTNAAADGIREWESEQRYKTGVTNWLRIFHGQIVRYSEFDPNDWDIIHVQVAGDSLDTLLLMREQLGDNSNTKIIANVDYALERWHTSFGSGPEMIIRQLRMADIVFSQTEKGARFLSRALRQDVPCLPHATDVDQLKRWATPIHERDKTDVCVHTHYDSQHYWPHWILLGWPVRSHLVGFQEHTGPYTRDNAHKYYTKVQPWGGCQDLCRDLFPQMYVGIDHYSHNVQGRTTIEFAGLGIPLLGWDNVDAQVKCFPDLSAPFNEIGTHYDLFERLMTDEDFYEDVSLKAQDTAAYYNYENSKARFLDMIGYQDGKNESPEIPSELLPAANHPQSGKTAYSLAASS